MATPTVRFGPHFRCHSGMVRRTRPQMCDAHRGISRFPDVHRTSEVRALRAPERRVENQSSQPPLPPFKTLQILKTLALVAGAAEVELLDVLVVAQLIGAAVEHHL